ncbi:uncharacterized protein LOC125476086 [Pyrus x bretschneideri]|uniref:uncharacterized protein LOC125476086 n=1 Tax=Pyrus x bretschneideri TaxID=225117 RepID=UPI00202F2F00|nr:uncharacterized protein LOC125476086 [Pyrus x bretschneideri]
MVFRNVLPILAISKLLAISMGVRYLKANGKGLSRNIDDTSTIVKWHPSDRSFVKLNFDGSVAGDKVAAAFVLRNHNGQIIGGEALNLDGATISEVKAKALREGLLFAQRKGYKKIMVKGDSKLVIQSVLDQGATPWNLVPIIEDVKWMATNYDCIH